MEYVVWCLCLAVLNWIWSWCWFYFVLSCQNWWILFYGWELLYCGVIGVFWSSQRANVNCQETSWSTKSSTQKKQTIIPPKLWEESFAFSELNFLCSTMFLDSLRLLLGSWLMYLSKNRTTHIKVSYFQKF